MSSETRDAAWIAHVAVYGWGIAWSTVLEDWLLVYRGELPSKKARREGVKFLELPRAALEAVPYSLEEMARVPRDPETLRALHLAKKIFGGGEVITEAEAETRRQRKLPRT